jgi:hypothetical protein
MVSCFLNSRPSQQTIQKSEFGKQSVKNVNSCNSTGHNRYVEEIRKKWTTYMSETKKKAAIQRREITKTGGGPPPGDLIHY